MPLQSRPRLSDLDGRRFDVVVVGAGVFGACFAYEMASRGLEVLLIEKDDFGSAASANSLRIVHGGLRYLQKLDMRRARWSASERSVLLRIFPGLVRPLLCALPTGPALKHSRPAFAAGLAVNALISADRNSELVESQRLPAGGLRSREWLAIRCPGLDLDQHSGAACWYDGFMEDPERMVFLYVQAAATRGASVINHGSAVEYTSTNGKLRGVALIDHLSSDTAEVQAAVAIDCTSGWMCSESELPTRFRRKTGIQYARGINLVLDGQLCSCAVGFRASGSGVNNRFLFMVPSEGKTIVGTWYLPLRTDPEDVAVSAEERARLLEEIASGLPRATISESDIVLQHVGVLPCSSVARNGLTEPVPIESPAVVTGESLGGPEGLWLVQGEKWTTARRTAQQVSETIAAAAGLDLRPSETDVLPLLTLQRDESGLSTDQHAPMPIPPRLRLRRGADARRIMRHVRETGAGYEDALLRAEALFAIRNEMALTLPDMLRRIGIGQLSRPQENTLHQLADVAEPLLGWPEERKRLEIAAVLSDARYVSATACFKSSKPCISPQKRSPTDI